ncbi:unnamed protein product [Diamesa serratosioi]
MENYCRLCMKNDFDLQSVFDMHDEISLPISVIIMIICPIKIESKDDLSKEVCRECLDVVVSAYQLREISNNNDRHIRKRLHSLVLNSPFKVKEEEFLEDEEIIQYRPDPIFINVLPKCIESTPVPTKEITKNKLYDVKQNYRVNLFRKEKCKSLAWVYFGLLTNIDGIAIASVKDYYFCILCVEHKGSLSPRYVKNISTTIMMKHLSNEHKIKKRVFKPQIRWPDLIAQIFIHAGFLYGLYYLISLQAKFYTFIWFVVLVYVSGFGITAGAHRLWSHRSYKAKWPLRALLVFMFTIAGQRDAYTWAHDHRVHHKYSETDSDPHNAKRGFFFAHVGWLFLTPHPDVVEKRLTINMSDLEADPIVMWQKKYYIILFALIVIAFPVLVPCYFWNEDLWLSFWVCFTCRFCTTLNIAFFVNSAAHMYGDKPYDQTINPSENLAVAIAAMGEGWHNYHHVFPWDYKTGEFGGWKGYKYNITTAFIDFFANIGWAYDRKSATNEMIARRVDKSGDGSHYLSHDEAHKTSIWGYGDNDITLDDQKELEKMSK